MSGGDSEAAQAELRKGESSKLAAQRRLSGRGTVYKEKRRQADAACTATLVQLCVHRAAAGTYRVRTWSKRELTLRNMALLEPSRVTCQQGVEERWGDTPRAGRRPILPPTAVSAIARTLRGTRLQAMCGVVENDDMSDNGCSAPTMSFQAKTIATCSG